MKNNILIAAACLVILNNKVLLVKLTYGKGGFNFPGGILEEGELLNRTAEREVLEETNLQVSAGDILAIRYIQGDIWVVFRGEYISGELRPDSNEIEEAVFMDIDEALSREDVIPLAKEILRATMSKEKNVLERSTFVNPKFIDDKEKWQLYI